MEMAFIGVELGHHRASFTVRIRTPPRVVDNCPRSSSGVTCIHNHLPSLLLGRFNPEREEMKFICLSAVSKSN